MNGFIKIGATVFQNDSYKQWPIFNLNTEKKNPHIIFDIHSIYNGSYNKYWICRADNYGAFPPKKYGNGAIFVTNEDDIIIFTKENCVHYKNIDKGIECTAKNCPCDLFEWKS